MKFVQLFFMLILSSNVFAADFTTKFCSVKDSGSVELSKSDKKIIYKYTLDDENDSISTNFQIISENSLSTEKDLIDILSKTSEKEIQSAEAYEVSGIDEDGTSIDESIILAKDSNGDAHFFELTSYLAYFGSEAHCSK